MPDLFYGERIRELETALTPLKKKRSRFGWLRLVLILGFIVSLWYTIVSGLLILVALSAVLLAAFLFFVAADLNNDKKIKNTEELIRINEEEQSYQHHEFHSFPDGARFQPAVHDYAGDLDIFGKASLYQYINRTSSEQGQATLAAWLLSPAKAEELPGRQEAIRELAEKTIWRQQLQADGRKDRITNHTEKKITDWLRENENPVTHPSWAWLRYLLPALSMGSVLFYSFDAIGAPLFSALIFFFFVFSLYTSKLVMPSYRQLNKIANEVDTLSGSIAGVEKENFQSPFLQIRQSVFRQPQGTASKTLRSLKKIIDRLDYRLNPIVFIPLNTLVFWDIQQAFALEKWKKENKEPIKGWFSTLAEFESLASLGTLYFNHPAWVFPEWVDGDGILISEGLGHPLIDRNKRKTSDFSTNGPGKISLITGSNMAGKSTFLRSVGVNIVLAMAGAPVCARHLKLSHLKVISSMRVSDNLEESTSTFYAELKKLKYIIGAVNRKEKVILLLDEILRGTNSADRHAGSTALIRQLIRQDAVALVATHDLELAKMEDQYREHIDNYHFDVQVEGEELYFDYTLKKGVCQSMNASLLMKKIGIDL